MNSDQNKGRSAHQDTHQQTPQKQRPGAGAAPSHDAPKQQGQHDPKHDDPKHNAPKQQGQHDPKHDEKSGQKQPGSSDGSHSRHDEGKKS